ncbi:MAG TPA: hypothetical protein VJU61_22930 [Polyangiaceae bacterium]|nr:hypothetical protein [Polyangiaceae bacterium]
MTAQQLLVLCYAFALLRYPVHYVALAYLVMLALGPLVFWLKVRLSVPEWEISTATDLAALPAEVKPLFASSDGALADLGFAVVCLLRDPNLFAGRVVWSAMYLNRSTVEKAMVAAVLPRTGRPAADALVSFTTGFSDGRSIETNNRRELNPLPPLPGTSPWQFPNVADARRLYRIHQLRAEPLGTARRQFPAPGAEIQAFTTALCKTYEDYATLGYLRAIEPKRYRPTVIGAILGFFRLAAPGKWLLQVQRALRNRSFLAAHPIGDT